VQKNLVEIENENQKVLSNTRGRISTEKNSKDTFEGVLNFISTLIKRVIIRFYSKEPSEKNLDDSESLFDATRVDENINIAIYTSVFGGYDNVQVDNYKSEGIDYFIFADNDPNLKNWTYIDTPIHLKNMDNIKLNRYFKMHPFEFFYNYDYVLYIDGNVQVVSDPRGSIHRINEKYGIALHKHARRRCIYNEAKVLQMHGKGNPKYLKKQIKKYKENNYPKNKGLLEATIILSNPKCSLSKLILQEWWNEFILSNSNRDQISLPYVLWKMKIDINEIGTLGYNLYRNPKYKVFEHK